MSEPVFREYITTHLNTTPLVEGRPPSWWLYRNWDVISSEDKLNLSLTEQNLKDKYPELK